MNSLLDKLTETGSLHDMTLNLSQTDSVCEIT